MHVLPGGGRPRTGWRDCFPQLLWEHLDVSPDKLKKMDNGKSLLMSEFRHKQKQRKKKVLVFVLVSAEHGSKAGLFNEMVDLVTTGKQVCVE